MRKRTLLLAATLTTGLLTALPTTASAAPSGLKGDFNGDGYGDLAFSAPYAKVSGKSMAGYVAVMYGGSAGVDPTNTARYKTFSQSTAGVPGVAEAEDTFGDALAAADFDGDGYTDLAVGASGEDVGSATDGGSVTVLWGSATGVSGGTSVKDPAASTHDAFGRLLTAGDFDGDGKQDLATGASDASVYVVKGGIAKDGTTGGTVKVTAPNSLQYGPDTLRSGDVNKDGKDDLVVVGRVEADADDPGTTRSTAWYYPGAATGPGSVAPTTLPGGGVSAAVGDINGDGYGEIVLGNVFTRDSDLSGSLGGKVTIVPGTANGPDPATAHTLTQASPGVPGTNEANDGFGSAVSVGDINGDGYGDLAIGTIFEDGTTTEDSGSTTLMYGSATGLSTTGARTLTQASAGVAGTSETMDYFGSDVLLKDLNGDGKADYTVSGVFENEGVGAITAMLSDGTGISPDGDRSFGPGSLGRTSTYGAFGANLLG
ncbi:VCBS repeat-containing protein [Streptomyces spongiae]|uniref:VCBS repeat-containing protein n=1 Tax=Streptomyces spongiae TaxID=565072 RepID=A0A5N8XWG7_9ACTN|nr:VCBS repeat-containing protein [Streptomyces spongiae]